MTLRRWVIAGLIVAAALMVWTSPVWAHSFLVDTQPSQGERLTRSPSEVVFQFTEAVVTDRVEIAVNTAEEANVDTGSPEAESDGRVVRIPLLQPVDGVAVVSWHVVSAVDGHESAGEIAFAVGEVGSLPTATSSAAAGVGEQGWRWLFLAGLSLGVGALVASATGQTTRSGWVGPARLGLIVAAVSPAAVYVTSTPRDLSVATLSLGAAAVFLSLAALTTADTRRTWPLILTCLGIIAWSARSHTATIRGVLGMAADAAHLAGASLWFGTLGVLVVALWRTRRAGGSLLDSARIYSRWALRGVIVLATAGLVSAVTVLTTPSDLWDTGYGRILLVKVLLFAAALTLAATGRWRSVPRHRIGLLRRVTTMEVIVVAAIMTASGLLAATPPPALAVTEDVLLGPPPLEGLAARAAGLAGNMTVGVQASGGRLDLLIYNSSTGGIDDAEIGVTAVLPDGTDVDLHPRPCGAGCFTQQFDFQPGVTCMMVTADSKDWTGGTVTLDLLWPPPSPQSEQLDKVIAVMRQVEQLTLIETVNSGLGAEATSSATISGDAFMDLEVYANADLAHVTPLPEGRGLQLYLPGSRILIDLHLDEHHRITDERIVSPGHEITRTITYP